jgi:DNA-binding LacI/PurR family transcriptional regulator
MSSIQDVAKEAGVSTATVSRTFSTPDLLSQQTRSRVIEVADRLNYRPRRSLSVKAAARDGQSGTDTMDAFGFLFFASDAETSPINEFYAPVLSGAQSEAARLGMHLIIRTAARYTHPQEVPKMFRGQAVAGTLLVGAALPDVLEAYAAHLPQSVLLDNRDETGRYDCILSDGFGGAYQATAYLINMGHRHIGFVLDETTAPSFRDRRRGYLCALWEAGLTPDPRWIVAGNRGCDIEERLEALLAAPERPTALLAANDMNAFTVMQVCRRLGLNIPQDLSLIGFDDIPFSIHAYPPLTTMRVETALMGRLAVRRLHARIQESQAPDSRPEAPVHLTIPVKLVERETCCSPR